MSILVVILHPALSSSLDDLAYPLEYSDSSGILQKLGQLLLPRLELGVAADVLLANEDVWH